MRRRQQHVEGDHQLERWLLTYADMITLLTAFFLMLYSMSVMSKGKFRQMAISVRSGFGGVMSGGKGLLPSVRGAGPGDTDMPDRVYYQYRDAMRNLNRFVEQHHLKGQVEVHSDPRGTVISLLTDGLLFERGQAALRPMSTELLGHVAQVLSPLPNPIQVEGHTCDLPIHTAEYPSNWELSAARAATVVRYFIQQGYLPARRLAAAGYADTRPVGPNDTEAHRARNRRVEIVILKSEAQSRVDLQRLAEIQRITAQPDAPATPNADAQRVPSVAPEQSQTTTTDNRNESVQGGQAEEP